MICDNCQSQCSPTSKFCPECGTPLRKSAPETRPELRNLTVIFVDLVGSVALSEQLDAEEYLEVLTQYRDECALHTKQHGGYVARFLGDGMLAYFGYPSASDDDPERATRAALAIVKGVNQLTDKKGDPLAARAGIATGIVVARDIDRHGAEQEHAVTGDIPNLAARLQGAARAGEVLVSRVTADLLGTNYTLETVDQLALKGLSRPVQAAKVLNYSPARTRFIARRGLEPGPIIGRSAELSLLTSAYQDAIAGRGRGVLLVAEAGIGKSRLTHEFLQRAGSTPTLIFQCAQQYASIPLHPIKHQLQVELGLTAKTARDVETREITRYLGLQPVDADIAQTLLQLLGSTESPDGSLSISEDQRRRALEALSQHYRMASRANGLVFVIEDIHWIDPSTSALLGLLVNSLDSSRIALVATSRPGYHADWSDNPAVSTLHLSTLSEKEAIQLVRQTSNNTELDQDVQVRISAQCDGNPLYIEELTRSVVETSDTLADGDDRAFEIPTSLEDTLRTRLDRLGNSKRAVQVGAVFGRTFNEQSLSAVVQAGSHDIRGDLEQAEGFGILERNTGQTSTTWRFRHALIQESAYRSLLKSDRRTLHKAIAGYLLDSELDRMSFSLVAHHFEFGGETEEASRYWELAGELDTKRSANTEAVEHLQRASRLLSDMDHAERFAPRILKINERLIGALRATRGYASSEVGALLEEMLDLSVRAGIGDSTLYTLNGLYSFHLLRSAYERARHYARKLLQISSEAGNADYEMIAYRASGIVSFYLGDQVGATRALQESLDRYDRDRHVYLATTYGSDHAETCCSYLSLAQWVVGQGARAFDTQNWAVKHSLQIEHAHSIAQSRAFRSMLHCMAGDWRAAKRDCEETIVYSEKRGLKLMAVWARTTDALADANLEPSPANRDAMLRAIRNLNDLVPNNLQPYLLSEAASAFLQAGDVEKARQLLLDAERISGNTGEAWARPESMRIQSAVERQIGQPSRAEALLIDAVTEAERQGAKLWLLRSAVDRHRHFPDEGSARAVELVTAAVDRRALASVRMV